MKKLVIADPRTRIADAQMTRTSGPTFDGMLNLSTPIVSVQDGPRMSGKVSNFGGKKAAPFRKGGKRRAKVLVAKAAVKRGKRKSADLSNLSAEKRKSLPDTHFALPKTREFPIHDRAHAIAALRLAGRVSPAKAAAVRAAVYRKYPDLKPKD